MAATITGKNAKILLRAHSGACDINSKSATAGGTDGSFDSNKTHSSWAIGDFSLTLDRGTNEQNLIGEASNSFTQGSLSVEGSMMLSKFAASGYRDVIMNIFDDPNNNYKYLGVSGTINTETSGYLSWCLASCQVTGYDVSLGDANTITEASVDFVMLNPQDLGYHGTCIEG